MRAINATLLGQELKRKRKEHSLTLAKVGEQVGLTDKTINAYERGRAIPPLPTFIVLCSLYNITLDEMVNLGAQDI